MVLKPLPVPEGSRGQFENDVKMYGTQTLGSGSVTWPMV